MDTKHTRVLHLPPDQADWLARGACYLIQDAGEGFNRGRGFYDQMLEVDKAAGDCADAASMIIELRGDRQTGRLETAREIAARFSDESIRWLGLRHIEVLEAEALDGLPAVAEAEREREASAQEGLRGRRILDALNALEKVSADEAGQERIEAAPPTPRQEVSLAEIVVKRDAIERMWDQYEAAEKAEDDEGKAKKDRLCHEAQLATQELQELTLRSISEGKLPGRAAAEAVVGSRAPVVDAVERAERVSVDA
jgi:hypothetical protein